MDAQQAGYEPLESCYARFVALLQDFMRHNRVRSVVEFGCGFWSYAREIDWSGIEYDGFDIVEGPVRWNRDHHGADNIRFHRLEDGTRLPPASQLISALNLAVLHSLPLLLLWQIATTRRIAQPAGIWFMLLVYRLRGWPQQSWRIQRKHALPPRSSRSSGAVCPDPAGMDCLGYADSGTLVHRGVCSLRFLELRAGD